MKIIIQTDAGEVIALTRLEEHLTKLFKASRKKKASSEAKLEAERILSCYLQALRDLSKVDLQILWYLKHTPFHRGLHWRMEEILRKQYETSCSLKNLDEPAPHSPFPSILS